MLQSAQQQRGLETSRPTDPSCVSTKIEHWSVEKLRRCTQLTRSAHPLFLSPPSCTGCAESLAGRARGLRKPHADLCCEAFGDARQTPLSNRDTVSPACINVSRFTSTAKAHWSHGPFFPTMPHFLNMQVGVHFIDYWPRDSCDPILTRPRCATGHI